MYTISNIFFVLLVISPKQDEKRADFVPKT